MFTTLFRNATLVDGSGAPAYRADLAVAGERIAAIGDLQGAEAATVLEAGGLVLAPGFIDVHVHSELALLAGEHTAGVQMGVTTELLCPDGMGFAPLSGPRLADNRRYLRALYGDAAVDWAGGSFPDYLARFAGRIRNNIAAQVPHGTLRLAVKGWAPGPATDEELAVMCRLARECMEAGAVGLSTGLEYVPALHADRRELVALSRAVAGYGGIYAAHIRAPREVGIAETLAIAEEAPIPVHLSHLAGTPEMYAPLEAAIARGIDVTWDAYPYCAGCTMLAYTVPGELLHTSIDQFLEELARPATRAALAPVLEARFPPGSPDYFAGLSRSHNRWLEGMRVREAAEGSGKPLADFVCDLLVDEELAPLLILPWSGSPADNEARLHHTLTHPRQMVATDGIYLGGRAHPRAWGTYPRILGRLVREAGWLSLEDAIRRMTGLPAARFGLLDRGLLRPGMAADLVAFNPEVIADTATFASPRQAPTGIGHILVNGVPVVHDGVLTGERPGRLVRRGR